MTTFQSNCIFYDFYFLFPSFSTLLFASIERLCKEEINKHIHKATSVVPEIGKISESTYQQIYLPLLLLSTLVFTIGLSINYYLQSQILQYTGKKGNK